MSAESASEIIRILQGSPAPAGVRAWGPRGRPPLKVTLASRQEAAW